MTNSFAMATVALTALLSASPVVAVADAQSPPMIIPEGCHLTTQGIICAPGSPLAWTLIVSSMSCGGETNNPDTLSWRISNCISARLPSGENIEIPKARCPPRGNEGTGVNVSGGMNPGEYWVPMPVLSDDGICSWQTVLVHTSRGIYGPITGGDPGTTVWPDPYYDPAERTYLFLSLSRRVLSRQEMATVIELGPALNIPYGAVFDEAQKLRELNAALTAQIKLLEASER